MERVNIRLRKLEVVGGNVERSEFNIRLRKLEA